MTQGTVQPVDGRDEGEDPGAPHASRRWRSRVLFLGVLALGLVAAAAMASSLPRPGEVVPRQIPYRGFLDQNGVPVTNSRVPMLFELYTCESGSTCRTGWVEPQEISVQEGQFTVALGDVEPIPAHLFAQPSLYLQIAVDGQLLAGRQRLLTVPYAQHAATSGFPPGAIIAFGGTTPPPGWLLCDGAALSRTTYPQLFQAIGTTYGAGNASTFNVPDLRGRFLRGFDRETGRDPGGRAADQVQDWATGLPRRGLATSPTDVNHTHGYMDTWYAHDECPIVPVNRLGSGHGDWNNNRCEDGRRTDGPDHNLAHEHVVTGGDPETRPTNVAVNWIIRAVP